MLWLLQDGGKTMTALSRVSVLAATIASLGPLLVSCKADNAPGYQVKVLIMLSDNLEPTTTVSILEDGSDINSSVKDATITLQLNAGTATQVPYVDSFGYLQSGNISGSRPQAGDAVTASMVIGSKHVGETVTVPAIPKVKAPGAAQDASKEIVMTWDSLSSPPSEIQIAIADKDTATDNPMGYFQNIPGTSTSYSIPAGTLKAGTKGIYFGVSAENTRQLTGPDLEPYSKFTISSAGGVDFDTL
jgi:hypothetical protein